MDWGMLQEEIDFVQALVADGHGHTRRMEGLWMERLHVPSDMGQFEAHMLRVTHRRRMYEAISVLRDRNLVEVLRGPVEWIIQVPSTVRTGPS